MNRQVLPDAVGLRFFDLGSLCRGFCRCYFVIGDNRNWNFHSALIALHDVELARKCLLIFLVRLANFLMTEYESGHRLAGKIDRGFEACGIEMPIRSRGRQRNQRQRQEGS